jgi:hypothetical protein
VGCYPLNLLCRHDNRKIDTKGLEVTLTATYFVCLARAKLEEILRPLCLADEIHGCPVWLEDGPIAIVLTDGRVNFKPRWELHEKLDVLPLIELAGDFTFNFGIKLDIFLE